MKRKHVLTAALLALAAGLASAGARQAAEKTAGRARQKPEGLVQMERLQLLVGTWSYTETWEKSEYMPNGSSGPGTYEARLGPGGYSLILDFTTHASFGDEIGHAILTWDPKEKAYKEYVVGNAFPGAVIFTGHWEGDVLVFDGEFEGGGKKTTLKSTYAEWTPKAITILESARTGDAPFHLLQTTKATKP